MPSPFPGMNPYFERAAVWQDFHTEFLTALRHQLAPKIAPGYVVQFDEHIYIHDLPAEPRRFVGRSDLAVTQVEDGPAGRTALGILEAPAEVYLPAYDVEKIRFLEVRGRHGLDLVTVVELLSPSNKRAGEDREQYLTARRELLHSPAHLVEIDLLRGWTPMPAQGRPEGDYSVLVSRSERRRAAAFWPIHLRDRLPIVPIPLRDVDEEARVDLRDVLDRAYDEACYEHIIYRGEPEPPLSKADAEWARQFVPR